MKGSSRLHWGLFVSNDAVASNESWTHGMGSLHGCCCWAACSLIYELDLIPPLSLARPTIICSLIYAARGVLPYRRRRSLKKEKKKKNSAANKRPSWPCQLPASSTGQSDRRTDSRERVT